MTKKKITGLTALLAFSGLILYYFYPEAKLSPGTQIDQLVVDKSERKLMAYSNGKLVKTYTVSLGGQPEGHKESEGDKKTPEGHYFINAKNPNSGYHKTWEFLIPIKRISKKQNSSVSRQVVTLKYMR